MPMAPFLPKSRLPTEPPPRWFWIGSLSLLLLGIVFFTLSLVVGNRQSRLFLAVIPIILVCALALHAYYLLHAGRERHAVADAFYVTDREFASIFEHALDGILILDNQPACLNANPAALRILGVPREELLGTSFSRFFTDEPEFARAWNLLLEGKKQRGNAELVRGDNKIVSVDYAIAANYVPGRHVAILCDTTERRMAEASLRQSQELLQEVTDHVQEVVWMLRADTKEVIYVSNAYETITGHSLAEIRENPSSYKDLVHPEDRARFLAKLEEARTTGKFDEEFRIVRPDGASRWIWSKGTQAGDADEVPPRLVGIAQDITSRKHAEQEIAKHLAEAEAARAEAEALRKATLTLTQNLKMDALLDTLLQTLHKIVPYDSASVLLTDTDRSFLVARQMPRETTRKNVVTLEVSDYRFLQKVLFTRDSVLVENTRNESEWRDSPAFGAARSWICIPLVVSENLVGLLSVSSKESGQFTREHLRLAKSLALSAAVAIQNARLYERAEIYASELELQVKLLKETQAALEQTQSRSRGTG
jgi:PAS domain S-box-containing protein